MAASYNIDEKEFLKRIGLTIRQQRIDAGLSQEKLSFECNLDRTYIGSVERGERNISLLNLRKIANTLNLSISELLNIKE